MFVRIEEKENGFEGLVHNTALDDGHPDHQQLAVRVGDALPVKILGIDPARRRITLSHRQAISVGQDEPGA
ncbi:S1 RNA-binding domain-containing protein [Streptomyces sp. JH14]|nr:S1 RNA-binding domain-containing protein [Streptomyces sp. JH14]